MTDAATLQRRMIEAVGARDYEALRALLHPDYTYTGGDGSVQKGADAGVAVAQTYTAAFPDIVLQVQHQWVASGEVAIMEFRAIGTHTGDLGGIPPTGLPVEIAVCNIVECRDGLILHEREYFDGASVMTQIGLLPSGA